MYIAVAVRFILECDGWPDSYQERNALIPHCMNMITFGMRGPLL